MKTVPSGVRIAAVATAGTLLLAGCGAANEAGPSGGSGASPTAAAVTGTISGAGATTQQVATQAWTAGFQQANPDATINYDAAGSGAGRTQFIAKGVDFAGSDAALTADETTKATAACGGTVVEVPDYVSPIAVVYHLTGVSSLQLDASTLAKIFNRKITTWNDPAIAALNSGVTLPAKAIAAVNRSDKSGTTANFTDYLSKAAPADWTYKAADVWPVAGGEAAQGTSGVVGAVKGGEGTIGYADFSQAADLGVAKLKVGDSYVAPSADGAAKLLASSQKVTGSAGTEFAFTLNRTSTDPTTYPATLVSYFIACGKYSDAAKANLVKAYLTYVVSSDGQAAASKAAGNAPLSDDLRTQITPAISAITGGA